MCKLMNLAIDHSFDCLYCSSSIVDRHRLVMTDNDIEIYRETGEALEPLI